MGDGDGEANHLLIVDDNPADIRFFTEAFENSQLEPTIHSVKTRDAALDFVYQRGEYADATEPSVVFLDWHLAQTTSEEVLDALKADYPHIPVAVMAGTAPENDPAQVPSLKADMSLEKPTKPEGYIRAYRSLF